MVMLQNFSGWGKVFLILQFCCGKSKIYRSTNWATQARSLSNGEGWGGGKCIWLVGQTAGVVALLGAGTTRQSILLLGFTQSTVFSQ